MTKFEDFKISPTERMWRTLLRVVEVKDAIVSCVIPCRNNNIINIPMSQFPIQIQKKLKEDFRLHARVNIGAESDDKLRFETFETH